MRNQFRSYYSPSETELSEIWSRGLIVLDTNTILNLFRYSPTTREEFFNVLSERIDSLWIPYQVGLEFHRNRLNVVRDGDVAFGRIIDAVESAKKTVLGAIDKHRLHPSLDQATIKAEFEKTLDDFSSQIESMGVQHDMQRLKKNSPGEILERLTVLFEGRVGDQFNPQEIAEIEQDGTERYELRVPPGYKDAGKPNGNQFGDLILWKELLRKGSQTKLPIVFVTDDAKEDWWQIEHGQTIGPRVELIEEYWNSAGSRIHFYEPMRFLRYAREYLSSEVSDRSLDEVEKISDSREEIAQSYRAERNALIEERAVLQKKIHYLRQEHGHWFDTEERLFREVSHIESRIKKLRDEAYRAENDVRRMASGYSLSVRDSPKSPSKEDIASKELEHRQIVSELQQADEERSQLIRLLRQSGEGSKRSDEYRNLARIEKLNSALRDLDRAITELE